MQIAFWLLEKFSRKGRPQTTTTKVSTYYFFAPVFLDRNLYINCCKMHSSTLLKEYYLFTVKFAVLGIIFLLSDYPSKNFVQKIVIFICALSYAATSIKVPFKWLPNSVS